MDLVAEILVFGCVNIISISLKKRKMYISVNLGGRKIWEPINQKSPHTVFVVSGHHSYSVKMKGNEFVHDCPKGSF